MLAELTVPQRAVYDAMLDYWFVHGFPAPYRELQRHFGYASPNSVAQIYDALISKGRIHPMVHDGHGHKKMVYAPVQPCVRVERHGNTVHLGTIAGAVKFTRSEWVNWLNEQLAATVGKAAA